MIRIINHDFKWIGEDCRSFVKGNAVLLLVEKVLSLVPFNCAISRTARHVALSIFLLKMVARVSMQQ
jgi:hypothetical protein